MPLVDLSVRISCVSRASTVDLREHATVASPLGMSHDTITWHVAYSPFFPNCPAWNPRVVNAYASMSALALLHIITLR